MAVRLKGALHADKEYIAVAIGTDARMLNCGDAMPNSEVTPTEGNFNPYDYMG